MALDQVDVDKLGTEEAKEMSFLDHLEELRWHLVRSAAAVVIFGVLAFIGGKPFFELIMYGPKTADFWTYRTICKLSETLCFSPPEFDLMTVILGEQFIVHFKFAIMIGLVFGFPYIFWEFWRFIKPGLYPDEKKAARGVVFICSFLFITGVFFGYFIISPFAITFLVGYDLGAISTPSLASYVDYMTMFTLPVGVVFELPVVVYFLTKIGLVTPSFLKSYRKHAFVVIIILAAIITPPDVVTQFLVGIPLYILYEISIIISKRVVAKQKLEEEKAEKA
jgi:sec-independent protein translocase protein TatC